MKQAPKKPNATATIEYVTPTMAQEWLRSPGITQRPLRRAYVERLRHDMIAGRFRFNGESLIFDADNRMIDGQHRCTACAEAGEGFWTVIVRGIVNDSLEASACIDTGGARTGSDLAVMDGMQLDAVEASCLASAARCVIFAELGVPFDGGGTTAKLVTNSDVLAAIRRHPGLVDAMRFVRGTKSRKRVAGPGMTTAMYYWLSDIDAELAATYTDQVAEGLGLTKEHVAYKVRSALGLNDGSNAPHLTPKSRCAIFIKGWNVLRGSRPAPQQIVYRPANGETFPEISGKPWSDIEAGMVK